MIEPALNTENTILDPEIINDKINVFRYVALTLLGYIESTHKNIDAKLSEEEMDSVAKTA